ncbi:hypothetical protein M3599_15350 [Niallia circulans]|uniref:hypothetical protein n=1 Tax=Niallia circulans TaxID=1397 RepID=UPI00203F88B2|nr:hypothetical protein [Niallia circulans]MCM2982301.1 hypothetical protein [Niallia circulans]
MDKDMEKKIYDLVVEMNEKLGVAKSDTSDITNSLSGVNTRLGGLAKGTDSILSQVQRLENNMKNNSTYIKNLDQQLDEFNLLNEKVEQIEENLNGITSRLRR